MLNSKDFDEIVKADAQLIKNEINKVLTDYFNFSNIHDFPRNRGLYFLYLNDKEETLLYIGSAFGKDRIIYLRCSQYLQKGNGGESFRGKIESLKSISVDDAIQFIRNNVKAKFVQLDEFDEDSIKQIEQVAIWSYQPPLNFVLKRFNFDCLEFQVKH